MPDFWSHHLGAMYIENHFNRQPKWCDHWQPMYLLGAQGPDIFYYINKLNPLTKHHYKSFGNALHETHIQETFHQMLEYVRSYPKEGNIAYVAGFITHYILDVHCHKIICQLGPDDTSHKRVEMNFDALCIEKHWKKPLLALEPKDIQCSDEQMYQTFIPFWNHILDAIFSKTIPAKHLRRVDLDFIHLQTLLVRDTLSKIPFKSALSSIFHYDLSLLQYHTISDHVLIAYPQYEHDYQEGLAHAIEALSDYFNVIEHHDSIESFIEKHIIFDYLGEDLTCTKPF